MDKKHSNGTEMRLVRQLPGPPWWGLALGLAAFVGSLLATVWLASPLPLLPWVAVIAFAEWRGIRCPQCGTRLVSHEVPLDGGPAYRTFYECPACKGMWESDVIGSPD